MKKVKAGKNGDRGKAKKNKAIVACAFAPIVIVHLLIQRACDACVCFCTLMPIIKSCS